EGGGSTDDMARRNRLPADSSSMETGSTRIRERSFTGHNHHAQEHGISSGGSASAGVGTRRRHFNWRRLATRRARWKRHRQGSGLLRPQRRQSGTSIQGAEPDNHLACVSSYSKQQEGDTTGLV